jgi:hypothetical protein
MRAPGLSGPYCFWVKRNQPFEYPVESRCLVIPL